MKYILYMYVRLTDDGVYVHVVSIAQYMFSSQA